MNDFKLITLYIARNRVSELLFSVKFELWSLSISVVQRNRVSRNWLMKTVGPDKFKMLRAVRQAGNPWAEAMLRS